MDSILSNALKVLSTIQFSYDLCLSSIGLMPIIKTEPILAAYMALKQHNVKIRIITEITATNIEQCRQVMAFAELRHLDNVAGNFTIADGTDYAGSADVDNTTGEIQKLVVSNVKSFVKLQQYLFETLWSRASPADYKIKEIEEGVRPEVTEIVHGLDSIRSMLRVGFARAK